MGNNAGHTGWGYSREQEYYECYKKKYIKKNKNMNVKNVMKKE